MRLVRFGSDKIECFHEGRTYSGAAISYGRYLATKVARQRQTIEEMSRLRTVSIFAKAEDKVPMVQITVSSEEDREWNRFMLKTKNNSVVRTYITPLTMMGGRHFFRFQRIAPLPPNFPTRSIRTATRRPEIRAAVDFDGEGVVLVDRPPSAPAAPAMSCVVC